MNSSEDAHLCECGGADILDHKSLFRMSKAQNAENRRLTRYTQAHRIRLVRPDRLYTIRDKYKTRPIQIHRHNQPIKRIRG